MEESKTDEGFKVLLPDKKAITEVMGQNKMTLRTKEKSASQRQ